jgi:hypothetical protein
MPVTINTTKSTSRPAATAAPAKKSAAAASFALRATIRRDRTETGLEAAGKDGIGSWRPTRMRAGLNRDSPFEFMF